MEPEERLLALTKSAEALQVLLDIRDSQLALFIASVHDVRTLRRQWERAVSTDATAGRIHQFEQEHAGDQDLLASVTEHFVHWWRLLRDMELANDKVIVRAQDGQKRRQANPSGRRERHKAIHK